MKCLNNLIEFLLVININCKVYKVIRCNYNWGEYMYKVFKINEVIIYN